MLYGRNRDVVDDDDELIARLAGGDRPTCGWVSPWHWRWPPWIWPARPPQDFGGALCAALVFVAGVAAITVLGARDSARE